MSWFPCFFGDKSKKRKQFTSCASRSSGCPWSCSATCTFGLVTLLAVGEDESIMGVCYLPGGNSILTQDLVGRPVVILRNASFSFQSLTWSFDLCRTLGGRKKSPQKTCKTRKPQGLTLLQVFGLPIASYK